MQNDKIKIYNPVTRHSMYVRSIYEIPNGYKICKHVVSDDARKNISDAAKKRGTPECAFRDKSGENNPMYMHKQTDFTKHKISETKEKKLKENPNYGVNGKVAYYDKDTLKIRYFLPDETVPSNYIKGRPHKN